MTKNILTNKKREIKRGRDTEDKRQRGTEKGGREWERQRERTGWVGGKLEEGERERWTEHTFKFDSYFIQQDHQHQVISIY